jgi:isocitrate/isopropylmalate dehydrogenase
VLKTLTSQTDLKLDLKEHDFGGIAIDNHSVPLPDSTLDACLKADAILMGTCNISSGSCRQTSGSDEEGPRSARAPTSSRDFGSATESSRSTAMQ